MRAAWTWLKGSGGRLAGLLLVLVGAGWLWRRKLQQLGAALDQAKVAEATAAIERLRGAREQVARQVGRQDLAIAEVDRQLVANKRALVEAHENGQGLSDQEVEDAFAKLGY